MNLFIMIDYLEFNDSLEAVDKIHKQFGFTKLVYAKSLTKGGTAIERAGLVGGHNGGE
jgi:DNA polymerase V